MSHPDGPVWQEDDEVTSCFLCHSAYSFFKRRHHCRKCGRVVCGPCSDHKIKYFPNTIIVNEYGMNRTASPYESYRTCEECFEEVRMIRRALFGPEGESDGTDEGRNSEGYIGGDGSGRGFDAGDEDISVDSVDSERVERLELEDNDSTTKYSTRTSTRMIQSLTSSLGEGAEGSSARRNPKRDRLHHSERVDSHRDDHSDADLCPVCATNLGDLYVHGHKYVDDLPSEDFERFKESHINDCLVAYDFNHGDNQRFNSPTAKSHPVNKMLVFNMPPIPKPQFENIPNLEGSSVDTIRQGVDTFMGSVNSSEKNDFADNYDNECVICLEDLKPGDKVARMECLCVFHYKCIKFWFKKKGFGECPVHFLHK